MPEVKWLQMTAQQTEASARLYSASRTLRLSRGDDIPSRDYWPCHNMCLLRVDPARSRGCAPGNLPGIGKRTWGPP